MSRKVRGNPQHVALAAVFEEDPQLGAAVVDLIPAEEIEPDPVAKGFGSDVDGQRITRQSDNLWLRILDLPSALQARSYESAADLTIAIKADTMCPHNAAVWCLDASPAGATCSRVEALPDLTIDVNSLASLYLGGMSASLLVGAGRIRPHRETAVADLARAFRTDRNRSTPSILTPHIGMQIRSMSARIAA